MAVNDNINEINKLFNELKKKVKPNRGLMRAIAGHMHASVMHNFHTSGRDVPGGWPPLAKSTLRQRSRKGFGSRMLIASGKLIRSIQQKATDNESLVFTNLRYAAIHHFGGEVFHHPRTRSLAFRLTRGGNLMRQEGFSNLVRFAKKSHKNALRYTISQQAYTVKIPARPFMVLTDTFRNKIIQEIVRQVTRK